MTEAQTAALLLAARLLAYPNQAFLESLKDLAKDAQSLCGEKETADFGKAAQTFIDKTLHTPAPISARRYVAVFDHTPAASLYMTWHRYGNDRSQGKAMAALNGLYRTAGFEPAGGDMPDYLPRMLEFLAVAPDWAAEALLDGFGPEIAALLTTLKDADCACAPFLELAVAPLVDAWPKKFQPREGPDPTRRPLARPEPEELDAQFMAAPQKSARDLH